MVAWINRAVFQLGRNGTTTHTVDPTSSTGLVAGATFTPTAGNLLVAVLEGAVTSTTPSGWTLPTNGSAINNTGLYVWHRTAASGSNSFTTTHNASNYPIVVAVYEFPSGSTFVASATTTGISLTAANPNLTGLTGTNLVVGVKASEMASGSDTHTSASWSGTGSPTTDVDLSTAFSTTAGYRFSIGYVEGYAGSSWQPTCTVVATPARTSEALTFAVSVAAGGGSVTGTLDASTPVVTVDVPTVSWSGTTTVPVFTGSIGADSPTVAVVVPTVAWTGAVTAPQFTGAVAADTPTITVDVATVAWTGTSTPPVFAGTVTADAPQVSVANPDVVWSGTVTDPGVFAGTIDADTPSVAIAAPEVAWAGTYTAPSGAELVADLPPVTITTPLVAWVGTVTVPETTGALIASVPEVQVGAPVVGWAGTTTVPTFTGTLVVTLPLVTIGVPVWVQTDTPPGGFPPVPTVRTLTGVTRTLGGGTTRTLTGASHS